MSNALYAPVPAIPPRPPQVTLLGSSVVPGDESDPRWHFPTGEQIEMLPGELAAELAMAREGADGVPAWIGGFSYQPENHYEAERRDPCDYSTIDYSEIATPDTPVVVREAGGGTLAAVQHRYVVWALDTNGHTAASAESIVVTNVLDDRNVITWNKVADYAQYAIGGRVHGSLGLLAVVGPFDDDEPATWTDDGSASPGASPPVTNTTGGPGTYSNLAVVDYRPILLVSEDNCSSFGFEEHDYKGRASRMLDNATPQALENELWTGALATAAGFPNNFLANSAAPNYLDVTPGSGAPSIARGLQILQDALQQAGFGGQGMIHVQAQTAPNLLNVRRVGPIMLDQFDNIVVPGVGYPGTGAMNCTPGAGKAYMYATDLVMCRVQKEIQVIPDTFSEALDRGQAGHPNLITFRAMRHAAAYFDGFAQFAIAVTLAT